MTEKRLAFPRENRHVDFIKVMHVVHLNNLILLCPYIKIGQHSCYDGW